MLTASAAIASGRLAVARQALVDARRHWGEQADPVAVGAWFAAIAYVDFLAGHYGAALKDAGYARRVAAADSMTIAVATRVLGSIELERGYSEAGERWLRESASTGAAEVAGMAAADLGASLVATGRATEGVRVLRRAAVHARGAEEGGWVNARLARVLAAGGRLDEAGLALDAARQAAASGPAGFAWIQVDLAAAELAVAAGAAAEALDAVDELLAAQAEAGVRSHTGDALLDRAAALGALGRAAERAAVLQQVRELALELGARALLARAG